MRYNLVYPLILCADDSCKNNINNNNNNINILHYVLQFTPHIVFSFLAHVMILKSSSYSGGSPTLSSTCTIFIYVLFVQEIFIEHVIYARHSTKSRNTVIAKTEKSLFSENFFSSGRRQTMKK